MSFEFGDKVRYVHSKDTAHEYGTITKIKRTIVTMTTTEKVITEAGSYSAPPTNEALESSTYYVQWSLPGDNGWYEESDLTTTPFILECVNRLVKLNDTYNPYQSSKVSTEEYADEVKELAERMQTFLLSD